jgi:hypothetical protein
MFRGNYKFKTANGSPVYYDKGDIIINQGKVYECTLKTSQSPRQNPSKWNTTGLAEPYQGENPPVNPIENQLWVSGSGITYIWFKDSDGFQWIQT